MICNFNVNFTSASDCLNDLMLFYGQCVPSILQDTANSFRRERDSILCFQGSIIAEQRVDSNSEDCILAVQQWRGGGREAALFGGIPTLLSLYFTKFLLPAPTSSVLWSCIQRNILPPSPLPQYTSLSPKRLAPDSYLAPLEAVQREEEV